MYAKFYLKAPLIMWRRYGNNCKSTMIQLSWALNITIYDNIDILPIPCGETVCWQRAHYPMEAFKLLHLQDITFCVQRWGPFEWMYYGPLLCKRCSKWQPLTVFVLMASLLWWWTLILAYADHLHITCMSCDLVLSCYPEIWHSYVSIIACIPLPSAHT